MRWRPHRLTRRRGLPAPAASISALSCSDSASRRSAAASACVSTAASGLPVSSGRKSPQACWASARVAPAPCTAASCCKRARLAPTRAQLSSCKTLARRGSMAAARWASSLTKRCDSMRCCPARLTASASSDARTTERETSPSFSCESMAASRSRRKAAASSRLRAAISRPRALSVQMRSSIRLFKVARRVACQQAQPSCWCKASADGGSASSQTCTPALKPWRRCAGLACGAMQTRGKCKPASPSAKSSSNRAISSPTSAAGARASCTKLWRDAPAVSAITVHPCVVSALAMSCQAALWAHSTEQRSRIRVGRSVSDMAVGRGARVGCRSISQAQPGAAAGCWHGLCVYMARCNEALQSSHRESRAQFD